MSFNDIVAWFYRLFGIKPKTTEKQRETNELYATRYSDITGLNITALVAQRLSNLVVGDSVVSVTGDNPRADYLDGCVQRYRRRLKNSVAEMLGAGGVVLKPYAHAGQLYVDVIPQARFAVIEQRGEVITQAGFIAEIITRNNQTFTRTELHTLRPNGVYTIEQRATMGTAAIPLTGVPEWANIPPIQSISGVDKMLFAVLRSPVDNRQGDNSVYGVPITYGQKKLLDEIAELLNELQQEFVNKGVFIGVNEWLFDANNTLPAKGIYKKFKTDDDDFFEVFSPDIRVQSYIEGINYKLGLLEKAIGTNKGVLTDMETSDATATAIKRSSFDTWALINSIRTELEEAIAQLVYAFEIIANVNGFAPQGQYEIVFDWDYTLLEDTQERFNQIQSGLASGYIAPWEARAWVMNESAEAAQQNLPEMTQLLDGA